MEKQMKRGCGFMVVHFSTFAPRKYGPRMLDWGGGYFEWEGEDGSRKWYSNIKTLETDVEIASPQHAVSRGLQPFRYKEEFYYRMRFRENDARWKPILRVPALAPESAVEQTVAWAVERADGGRGFATTTGHYYADWENANWRRMILNAVLWTAGLEVPAGGVSSEFVGDEEVNRTLLTKPIRTLIVTGANHPSHKWQETTPAIASALNSATPRFDITVTENPEDLAKPEMRRYGLVVLNYANWEKPGLSEAAKAGFVKYLKGGGGLLVVHFANGAFHASLPGAGASSDWPEYRRIVRRIWNGEKGKSSHDRFGKMKVKITNEAHPIMKNVADFETTDELYFKQEGEEPLEVLATAKSNVTGHDEPMAWVYTYGKARVFQTVLGHAAVSLQHLEMEQMLHQAGLWAARQ
jgi:type 1 glutamine amidotransferase